jgi:8-oxo-dGTP pyrophosphatase MutT (NUDIX family)
MDWKEPAVSIAKGRWSETTSWEFFLSEEMPPPDLCTAVCCITAYRGRLALVKNKRGWEMPAGRIESTETPSQSVTREVAEETRLHIDNPKIFGYKKITSIYPVQHVEDPALHYPFPISYVVFFSAEALEMREDIPTDDIFEIKLVSLQEARFLLEEGHQYDNILQYAIDKGLISINRC